MSIKSCFTSCTDKDRENAPAKWKAMADYIMEQYAENDVSAANMLEKQKAKLLEKNHLKSLRMHR